MKVTESNHLNERDQLKQRIFSLLDGEMEAEEVIKLDLELQNDPEARALYIQFANLHSALQVHHDSRLEAPEAAIYQINRFIAHQRRRFFRFSTMVAAALVVFSALVIWSMRETQGDVIASFIASDDSVFTVSHNANEKAKEQLLHSGSHLKLTSGRIEAIFNSGVRCVIEAPCEIICLSVNEINVPQGKAWFHVPPAASGFIVRTPQIDIVDLGTEFGVVASQNGEDEIHVAVGSVEASPRKNSDNRSSPKEDMQLLKAGQARRIDKHGNLVETAFHAARFNSSLSQPLMIRNASFENTGSLSNEGDEVGYGPIQDWATSGLGVGMNNIKQPFLNQPAHSGSHVAFIQSNGLISQSISGFDPTKLYTISYFANERGLSSSAAVSTSVSLDLGSNIYEHPGQIQKTDAFRRIVSDPLQVFGPSANIEIRSQNINGDATLLIDSVSIARATPRIPDGGFEFPILPSKHFLQAYQDHLGHLKPSSWSFQRGAGIIRNLSPFTKTPAPEGSQAAVFQDGAARAETTIHHFEPGVSYRLCFSAKGRDSGAADLRISLNDTPLRFNNTETLTTLTNQYQRFSSDTFQTDGGSLKLKIESLSEGSSFIDDLHFEFVAEAK